MRSPVILATLAIAAACARSSGGDRAGEAAPADSIVLERRPCYGVCPSYRLSIAASGAVRFVSQNTGDSARVETDTIARDAFTRLLAAAARAGFDSLPARIAEDPSLCRLRATDHATVVVTVFRPAAARRVEDYTGCYAEADPPRMAPALMPLRVFESDVDRTAGVARWVKPARGKA